MKFPNGDGDSPIVDDYTIPAITFCMWMGYAVWGLLSLNYIRRNYFELFRFSHNFYYILLMVLIHHASSIWY